MRIGILGGTFDPPHNGHMAMAKAAMEHLHLDEVIFMPARRNPNKKKPPVASVAQRMEMIRLAIANEPKFAMSDLEIGRKGPSYTIETLDMLTAAMPAEYWLIMGADSVYEFESWRHPQRIIRLARIALVKRDTESWEAIMGRVPAIAAAVTDPVPMPLADISSTQIRLAFESRKSVDGKVPKAVLQYIRQSKLYGA